MERKFYVIESYAKNHSIDGNFYVINGKEDDYRQHGLGAWIPLAQGEDYMIHGFYNAQKK